MDASLYKKMGFKQNPFSRLSAEEERSYLSEIYVKPRYFDTLLDDIKDGNSRLIFGKRGIGKSSLLFELDRSLKRNRCFSIIIDSFDNIPTADNLTHLAYRVNEELVTRMALYFTKYPHLISHLNKAEINQLAFLIKEFYYTVEKDDYLEFIKGIKGIQPKNILGWIYKFFRQPLNVAANASVEIVGGMISKSLGLDKVNTLSQYKEYFPDIKDETISRQYFKEELIKDARKLRSLQLQIISILNKVGFSSITVLFDRIDEIPALEGKINKVTSFLKDVLVDTTILHNGKLSFVFSLWDQTRDSLNVAGVRFDKFRPTTMSWTFDELSEIVQKRLKYFSENDNDTVTLESLLPRDKDPYHILTLSYRSPRDVIRLLSHIYDEQANEKFKEKMFSRNSINRGKLKFVRNYDYNSVIPSGKGKENVVVNINRLLKVGSKKFTIKYIIRSLKVSQQTAISYVKIFKDLGLIEELDERNNNAKIYEIQDPKINYAIFRRYKSLSDIHF